MESSLPAIRHARGEQRETAVPRRRATHSTVVEPAHEHECQRVARRKQQQEQQWAVAGALRGNRREKQPAVGDDLRTDAIADQHSRHGIQ